MKTQTFLDDGGDAAALAAHPEEADLNAWLCRALIGAERHAQALPLCREAAAAGSLAGQWSLGTLYDFGFGVAEDPRQAAHWYRQAAIHGYAWVQHNLGLMYLRGRGVARNPAQAAEWFQRAAEQGQPRAQFNLGVQHLKRDAV